MRFGGVTVLLIECGLKVFEQTYQVDIDQAKRRGKIHVFVLYLGPRFYFPGCYSVQIGAQRRSLLDVESEL